jgi:hypothetical protein
MHLISTLPNSDRGLRNADQDVDSVVNDVQQPFGNGPLLARDHESLSTIRSTGEKKRSSKHILYAS